MQKMRFWATVLLCSYCRINLVFVGLMLGWYDVEMVRDYNEQA